MKKRTLKDLKKMLDGLTPQQLKQEFVVFIDDNEIGSFCDWEKSKQTFYWEGSDCCGTLNDVRQQAKDEGLILRQVLPGLTVVPKGTISFVIETGHL